MAKRAKRKSGEKRSRTFKRGELKRLLGIPEPKELTKNSPKYCRQVAAIVDQKLKAGEYDGKLGGLLRRKAVYYRNWYRWRAKNDRTAG